MALWRMSRAINARLMETTILAAFDVYVFAIDMTFIPSNEAREEDARRVKSVDQASLRASEWVFDLHIRKAT